MENGVVIKGVEYKIVADENKDGCSNYDLLNNKF